MWETILTAVFLIMAIIMAAMWVVDSINEELELETLKPRKKLRDCKWMPVFYVVFVVLGFVLAGMWEN
jgi:preprotein translocase subunit SecG